MKFIFLITILLAILKAYDKPNETNFVRFDTGASFVFIQLDTKNEILSIISEAHALVKNNGNYCYLPSEIYKKYDITLTTERIPDRYCKDKPPHKNIVKKLHTVMHTFKFIPYPETRIEPFSIPDNYYDEIQFFLYNDGIFTNETKEIHQKMNFKNNSIELYATGRGINSREMCGGVATNTISLTINADIFFKNIILENCFDDSIHQIDINFKSKTVIFHLNDGYKDINKFFIPFDYFIKHQGIVYLSEKILNEFQALREEDE